MLGRMLTFVVNPEMWEEWKEGGGDPGLFDVDPGGDADGNGNGRILF